MIIAQTARDLIAMFEAHRQQIATLGRSAPTALRVHEFMQAWPIVTIQTVADGWGGGAMVDHQCQAPNRGRWFHHVD